MKTHRIDVLLILSLITGLLLVPGLAQAQNIRVIEAQPAQAEQGVIELDVEISGGGFDSSAEAVFLVTGSEADTGGVVVHGNTYVNSKKLISRITIPDTATLGDYDIEVHSGGRRGKGNTLFKVLQKNSSGGNSNHWEEVSLCITVVEMSDDEMSSDSTTPYCEGSGSTAILDSFEGSLRFNPNFGTRKNPSDRFLLVDAVGCTDRACDPSEVSGISTEREHQLSGTDYVAGDTAVFWDMSPGEVTRVEGRILLDRYRAFKYSTPNSDRIECPTNLSTPMWLSCDGKIGSDTSMSCNQWTLSTYDLGQDNAGDGAGNASPCLVNDQRGQDLEDVVELDFAISICVKDQSCSF